MLVEESVSQGDLERAMGLPVLPMNDRDKIVLADSQIGFIRFVALELFDSVRQLLPEMSFTVDCIKDNLKRWEYRKQQNHHDSGIGSLISSTTSPQQQQQQKQFIIRDDDNDNNQVPLIGCKRRSNSLDYHSQAVEVLRKRLSLDTTTQPRKFSGRRRSSAGDFRNKLSPSTAAIAMQTFHESSPPPPTAFTISRNSSPSQQQQQQQQQQQRSPHHHHHHHQQHELASHDDGNPAYCQCNIQ